MAKQDEGEGRKRLCKAFWLGPSGKAATWPDDDVRSKQLTEDPFEGTAAYGTLVREPPYSLEQLVMLAESHPVHAAALEQKAVDVVASGVQLEPTADDANEEHRDAIMEWLDGLAAEGTLIEILNAMWLDYETVGWGVLELGRDTSGVIKKMWHVPAHTVRAHRDNKRYVQMRHGKVVWFKRWNTMDESILASDGRVAWEGVGHDKLANEFLVFRKPSRRSTWYGIPTYIAALGHITLAIAARDFNIRFFSNAREPRHMIVISGVDEEKVDEFLEDLTEELKTQHGAGTDPHRNLLLALSGGQVDVVIKSMALPQNDLHFTRLLELTDRNILIAHRMPPDRLGFTTRGSLGGSVTADIIFAYKNGVVSPGQAVLADRLNRFLGVEYARAKQLSGDQKLAWKVGFEAMDLSDEMMDTKIVAEQVKINVKTLNEARERLGMEARDGLDVTLAEFMAAHGVTPAAMASATVDHPMGLDMSDETVRRLEAFDELVRGLREDIEGMTDGDKTDGDPEE